MIRNKDFESDKKILCRLEDSDGGTYITRDGLVKYLSGYYTDVMLTTYVERPRMESKELNPAMTRWKNE